MMTPQQLLEALASTRFARREHVLLERSGGVAVAVRIAPAEAREAWLEARGLLDVTGRWPVAMCSWSMDAGASWSQDVNALLDVGGFGGDRSSVATILEQARSIDLDAVLAAREDDWWTKWNSKELTGEVAWAVNDIESWFEPMKDQHSAMVFLPTAQSAATVVYESWYAESPEKPATALVALLERWNATYGAEVMAHWGTMLQLRIERPPRDIAQARELAREQLLVAPCTAMLHGTHPEHHAEALLQAKSWFLHERP